jgi:tRNA (cytidine/uridine-2'-O-)-methyltransferase
MQVVLYQPEIPPNTGNIVRLCAATATPLNLIEPLGFKLEDKYLRRAGLDYWPHVQLKVWPDWPSFVHSLSAEDRVIATSAKAKTSYQNFTFSVHDVLVFGPETKGLPQEFTASGQPALRIPIWGEVRSLNISNAVAVVLYEAYRQVGALPS